MMKLLKTVSKAKENKSESSFDIKSLIEETTTKQVTKKCRSVSETSEPEPTQKKRSGRISEGSEVVCNLLLLNC